MFSKRVCYDFSSVAIKCVLSQKQGVLCHLFDVFRVLHVLYAPQTYSMFYDPRWQVFTICGALGCPETSFVITTHHSSCQDSPYTRLGICRDWRSCKIFVSCVNFSRKQQSFSHILQVYTHPNLKFLLNS